LFHVSSKKHSKTTNKPAEHKTIDPALMSKEASNDEVKLLNEIKNYKSKLISDKVAHIDLVKSIANKNVQLQTELAKPLSEQKPHGADDLNEMLLADTEALNMLKDSIDQGEAQLKAANLQLHELNPQKYSVNGKTKAELKSELETLDNTIQKVKDAADKRFNDIQTTKDGYNELAKEDNDENFEALKELDNGITEAQEDYDELSSQLQDLQNKFDELRAEYESVNDVLEEDAKIEDIEKENNLRDQAKELKIEMININNQISVANESLSSFVQTFEEELKKSDDEKDQVKIETLSKEITDRENEINYLRNALKDTAAKRDNVSKELRAISKKTAKLSKDKPAKSAKSLFDEIGEQLPKAPQEIESSLELSGENILINKPNESEIVHDLHELKMESEATEIPLSNKQTYIELPDMSEES
jgi:chromosome segregation ATPase